MAVERVLWGVRREWRKGWGRIYGSIRKEERIDFVAVRRHVYADCRYYAEMVLRVVQLGKYGCGWNQSGLFDIFSTMPSGICLISPDATSASMSALNSLYISGVIM